MQRQVDARHREDKTAASCLRECVSVCPGPAAKTLTTLHLNEEVGGEHLTSKRHNIAVCIYLFRKVGSIMKGTRLESFYVASESEYRDWRRDPSCAIQRCLTEPLDL